MGAVTGDGGASVPVVLARVLVDPLDDAVEDLRSRVGGLEGAALSGAVGRAALSIALHRTVVDQDLARVDAEQVGRSEDDDARIAGALEALSEALLRLPDPPVVPLAAALMRSVRHPELAPRSVAAVRRLAADPAGSGSATSSATGVLRAFAGVLLDRADHGPRRAHEALGVVARSWPAMLRWSLIDLLTIDAARAGDTVLLEGIGGSIVGELVRAGTPDFVAVRRWLAVCGALRDRDSDADGLGEAELQVLDALSLREEELAVGRFLEELQRDPSVQKRRALIYDLWVTALDPRGSASASVLTRIRNRFGDTSPYERRVAGLADELRWESGPDELRRAVDLLASELTVRAHAPSGRIPWMAVARDPDDPKGASVWAFDSVFAAAIARAVLKGRALAASTGDASLAEIADGLLADARAFLEARGADASRLAEGGPMWDAERLVLDIERIVGRGEPAAAFAEWSRYAAGLRGRVLADLLRAEASNLRAGSLLSDETAQLMAALVLHGLTDTSDENVGQVATAISGVLGLRPDPEFVLPGFRWHDGSTGAAAIEALVGAVDRFLRASEWRLTLRSNLGSLLRIFRADGSPTGGAEPSSDVAAEEISAWVWRNSVNDADARAKLAISVLLRRSDGATLEDLRRAGWFDRGLIVPDGPITWDVIENEHVEESIALREEAERLRALLSSSEQTPDAGDVAADVAADGGDGHADADAVADVDGDGDVDGEGDRDGDGDGAGGPDAAVSTAWAGLRRLGKRLQKDSSQLLRARIDASPYSAEVREASYAVRVLIANLLREGDLDFAVEVIRRGQRLLTEIGHPYTYMDVVRALTDAGRVAEAADLLRSIAAKGGLVDLHAITAIVSAYMRSMTARLAADPRSEAALDDLQRIEDFVAAHAPSKPDALLYGRLIRANALVGRLERCEELAEHCKRLGLWDHLLDVELIRARARDGSVESVEEAVESAKARVAGHEDLRELLLVVARSFGSAGRIHEGLAWIRSHRTEGPSEEELFHALVSGVSLAGWHHSYVGKAIDLEDLRSLQEGMYNGDFPLEWASIREVLSGACRLAVSGSDSDRLVVAQESSRLMAAAKQRLDTPAPEVVIEQLCWVVKWTRSGRLADQAAEAVDTAGLEWTPARAGRLIEALAFSRGVDLARRLLRRGLEVSTSDTDTIYLYNVFLSVLRGREHEDERNSILREMQDQGLELDRFSRAELSAGLAAGRAFEDDTRMLRSSTAAKWQELVGPLRDGAELFEPIVARLRLELRTLSRALAADRPLEVLAERAEDVAGIARELAVSTQQFQESVSLDDSGTYSATRYAIASDIVHELSQPSVTLALQVRGLRKAIGSGDTATAKDRTEELLATARVLGLKLKSYRDSLAEADAGSFGEDDVSIHRAFERAVETLDPDILGRARILGAEALQRDQKYDRELMVRGNGYLLQRAFHAMLTNSLEAMRTAGVEDPTIQVEGLYHPSALIDGARFGTVQFFISDNGPGIPEGIRDEIFKAGFTTRRQRGLGLGLATVASIVEVHGGIVQLVDPHRARFILVLPAADVGRGETAPVVDGSPAGDGVAAPDTVAVGGRPTVDDRPGGTTRISGVVVRVRHRDAGADDAGADHAGADDAGGRGPRATRGWLVIDGIDTPVSFTSTEPGVDVGATLTFRLRQSRTGPWAEDVLVADPPPREPRVTGIVEQAPDDDQQYGFILVRELGRQVAFFDAPGTPELEVGDLVSAVVVPAYNWARAAQGHQAIDIRRI
jgi:signal transduction histidine kinase